MNNKNTLLQITQNGMGQGDDHLALLLITNYFNLILKENNLPKFITFYNGGVKLICYPSPVIDSLKNLEQRGVKLIACKSCLNHFNLTDQVTVGHIGSMVDIIELQNLADKVINL